MNDIYKLCSQMFHDTIQKGVENGLKLVTGRVSEGKADGARSFEISVSFLASIPEK